LLARYAFSLACESERHACTLRTAAGAAASHATREGFKGVQEYQR